MRIDQGTEDRMRTAAEELGESIGSLVDLGGGLRGQLLFEIDRQLLGARGEVFTADRRITFRSDRSFRKLKESAEIPYATVEEVEFDGGASWIRWTFRGASGKFEIELENYTGRNGLGPAQIVWYDIDSYPVRSGLFFRTVQRVIEASPLGSRFSRPSEVSRWIEEAVAAFEQSPTLVSESLSQPNPFHLWTDLKRAFGAYLAGATRYSRTQEESWLTLFLDLDEFYARILERFMREIDERSGAILSKESAILALSDQFDRLTALWYLRQIARLHVADGNLEASRIRPWSLSILTPRALHAGNRLSIRLRERELYETELRTLRGVAGSAS